MSRRIDIDAGEIGPPLDEIIRHIEDGSVQELVIRREGREVARLSRLVLSLAATPRSEIGGAFGADQAAFNMAIHQGLTAAILRPNYGRVATLGLTPGEALGFRDGQVVNPDGTISPIPCLANLFGTVKRGAMGVTLEGKNRTTAGELREVGELLAFLRNPTPPRGLGDAMEMLPLAQTVMSMRPRTVKKAPVQEVVLKGDQIDLTALPVQSCWPGEPAPLITWGLVVTKGPSEDREDDFNLGIYRMQVLGKDRAIMRWLAHRGGAQHYARHKKARPKEPLPCAVVLGADPGTILAAVTPVPDTLSEYQFAGLMRGAKAELVPCKTVPLMVPAQAEIVLEGHVLLNEFEDEGPYGDHTGYYNSVEKFPVFQVSAITMRKDPIYLTTFTGRPPDEPSVLG